MAYLGDPVLTIRWMSIPIWILCIIAAAFCALDAARISRKGFRHLVASTKHGRRRYIWAICWTVIPAVAVHTTIIVVLVVKGEAGLASISGSILAIACQCASLTWFSILGSAVGRYFSPITGAMCAAVVSWFLTWAGFGLGRSSAGFSPFGDSGATVSQVGITWNISHLLMSLLFMVLTGMVLLLPIPRFVGDLSRPTKGAAIVSVSIAFAMICSIRLVGGTPMVGNGATPDQCMRGDSGVEYCFFSQHAKEFSYIRSVLEPMFEGAKHAGYDILIPDLVTEDDRRVIRGNPGNGVVSVGDATAYRPNELYRRQTLAISISTPNECFDTTRADDAYLERWDDVIADSSNLAFTWTQFDGGGPTSFAGPGNDRILKQDEIENLFSRWRDCEGIQ